MCDSDLGLTDILAPGAEAGQRECGNLRNHIDDTFSGMTS